MGRIWKIGVIMFSLLTLFGCEPHENQTYRLDHRFQASQSQTRVQVLVIHYTAEELTRSLQLLTGPSVSAHYVVPVPVAGDSLPPTLYQLVAEEDRASHAGESYWRGNRNLNDVSVGIEIVNLGYRDSSDGQRHWFPYPQSQTHLVKALLRDLIERHQISPANVVGHSDIAPQRKQDPGPLFPWAELAREGIGAWPDAERVRFYLAGRSPDLSVSVLRLQKKLLLYGYESEVNGVWDEPTRNVIAAFQMHFRPENYSGVPDAETEAILDALLEKYPQPSRNLGRVAP